MKAPIPQKIAQIEEFVFNNPGCTTYEIIQAFDKTYGQLIYYASCTGLIQTVKDTRHKRSNLYYATRHDHINCSCISEKERVPE